MASLFVLDVDEYEPLWKCAVGDSQLEVHHVGPYVELELSDGLTIDRVSTGMRHALWYSGIAGLTDAKVIQFDKTALRIVARELS